MSTLFSRLSHLTRARQATRRQVHLALARAEKESRALRAEIQELQSHLDRRTREWMTLERQFLEATVESGNCIRRCAELEQQNTNLANLYVASHQLNGTLERRRVLDSIQEIVINLIGSEEVAIFELDEQGKNLVLISSFGCQNKSLRSIPVGIGLIGRAMASGQTYLRDHTEPDAFLVAEENLTACVPVSLDNTPIGAIAIFRLLGQKAGLQPVDHELLDILGKHAATALYCSGVRSRALEALAASW